MVHERSAVNIRPDMPLDRVALIGCAVMTCAGAVFRTAKVEPGSTVAVIGLGGIGLSAVNGATIAGAGRIFAIDRVASKLDLAKEFGATDVLDAGATDTIKAIREMTGGGVEDSFECVGSKTTVEQAFRMLRRGGTATVIGMMPLGTRFEVSGAELLGEKRIQGSAMGTNKFRIDMPRLVDFYLRGDLKLDRLISGRIQLAGINDAFKQLKTGKWPGPSSHSGAARAEAIFRTRPLCVRDPGFLTWVGSGFPRTQELLLRNDRSGRRRPYVLHLRHSNSLHVEQAPEMLW